MSAYQQQQQPLGYIPAHNQNNQGQNQQQPIGYIPAHNQNNQGQNQQQLAAFMLQLQQQQQQQVQQPVQQPMPPLNGALPLQIQVPVPVGGNIHIGGQVPGIGGPVLQNGGQVVPAVMNNNWGEEVVVRSKRRKKAVKDATTLGNGKISLNESVKALIHHVIRKYIYRRVKFLSSPAQQVKFVADVFEATEMINFHGGLQEFASVCGDFCLSNLNAQRNYIVDQVKNCVWDYMDDHEGEEPDFALMKSFAKREVVWNTASAPTKRLFAWYAGPLLTRATGVEDWGKPKMCFERISAARLPNQPTKKHVPPSTEAFLLLILEGHVPVWKAQYDFRQTNSKDVEYPNIRFKKDVVIPDDRKPFICKFTNPNGGGGKYGGWYEAVWDQFLTNKTEITIARQGPNVEALENSVMLALRTKCKITQTTMAEWLAAKNAKTTANPVLPVERAGLCDEE